MLTEWGVLFKALDNSSYSYIQHRYPVPDLDATDTLRLAVDNILRTPEVSNYIEHHVPESWWYEIYELPELPITGPAPDNRLRAAYEGSITGVYLSDSCIKHRPPNTVGDVEKPLNLVLIIYEHASRSLPRHSDPSTPPRSPVPEHHDQAASRNEIASAGKVRKRPSVEGTVERLRITQTSTFPAAVHNGRPLDLKGLNPSIYYPAFATFLRLMHDQEELARADVLTARRCVDACVAYYSDTDQRIMALQRAGLEGAVHPQQTFLTQIQYLRVEGDIWPKGSLSARAEGSHVSAPFCIVEVENEVGQGACDPIAQAEQCYKAFYCSNEARPYYEASCCPCLLVGIAGPNIMVSAAVVGDHITAQPLTDYISFIPRPTSDAQSPHAAAIQRMARLIRALRETLAELEGFYKSLKLAPPSPTPSTEPCMYGGIIGSSGKRPRYKQDVGPSQAPVQKRPYIGPHFTTFTAKDGAHVELKYTGRLYPEGRRTAVFTALAYIGGAEAETAQPKAVVVKFAHTYSAVAHARLAAHALAPKLWFCEQVPSVGMHVVVMDHLPDVQDAADRPMTPSEHALLRTAIGLLHDEDLVFGDLRGPNVLLSGGGLVLVDFEWCGKEGEVCYPEDINMHGGIEWHEDVFPGGKIKKEHDLHMLEALVSGENDDW